MTVSELIPTIQGLSHADKLLLLQILVQELLKAEGIAANLPDPITQIPEALQSGAEASPLTLADRQAFLKQPLAERRRLLAEQAEAMQHHYAQNPDWQELMAGDIVEY